MQSWPNPSQDDGGGQDAWQSSFAFGDQGAAFDPNQQWAQQMSGQTADFSHLHQDPAAFFDASSASSNPYMQAQALHGSPTNQPAFPAQPYGQQDQDAIDTAFHNVHPDLYAHGAKTNAAANSNQLDEGQAFAQHNYPFPPGNAAFHQQPFAQSHLQQHPVNHQPEQYGAFPQNQQAAVQPQRVVTPQNAYRQGPGLAPPPTGQPAQYQTDPHLNYPTPRQQYQLQSEQVNTQQPPRQAYQDGMHTFQGQAIATPQNSQYMLNIFSPLDATGPAPKKRKRTSKTPESSSEATQDSISDTPAKKVEDMDTYPVPVPAAEDQERLTKFNKRGKSAQVKYPSINGLPHLVFDGSMKMPAPKSFDKLAPLVTLPPRSGKSMVPELGYSLPCEIQGKFTSQYRPAPDRAGLNERRMEAKDLLDQFEASMKAMGKRRPKYTEYPHAFKEQMKSDEAVRNKAGKKAKKELDGDQNKSLRSAIRPTDLVEAASWDAIGIVHLDQSVARTSSLIAQRVQQAGDLFIKLRGEMNKAKQELDQATKDEKPESELAVIKANYEQRKEAFYRALDATVEHADDAVLDNLGGHHKLILSLVNALISCVKAADYSGKLPKTVLELISLFRMTKKIADTTNFETVRKRFGDKGDADVKEIIKDINTNIKKVMKASESETATGYTGTSAASRAKAATKSVADTTIKRSREDDSDSRTSKKIVVELPSSSSLLKKLAQPKAQPQVLSKPVASSILPGKSRPAAKPIAKPEIPASVGSPTASGDEKPKAPVRKVSDSKTEPAKVPVPLATSSSALSGIASLLDSINAPKAEAAAAAVATKEAEVEDDTETPAAKAKRLRKLERRKLRVSWKPDHDLVQVKVFQKDDNEDEGRAMNMIRDAADDKSEGMMLKQRVGMDEDDDDDDVPYQPWLGPVETDLSGLPADTRSKNFVTRGGTVTFSTEEQKRIAEREQRELMAIYTDPGDIPPTPKSPPPESAKPSIQGKVGQLPSEDAKFAEIQRRWADEQQMGVDQALLAAVQRLEAKQSPANKLDAIFGRLQNSNPAMSGNQPASAAAAAQQPISMAASNVPLIVGLAAEEGILAWLRSDKIAAWRDPNPVLGDVSRPHQYADSSSQAAGQVIEAVAQYLQGKPYPANAPPDWMLQYEDKVKEWWFGYNKEGPARQRREEERRARAAAEAGPVALAQGIQDWSYAQQQEYAPYMAILQQMNGGNSAAPPVPQQQPQINDSQLQSILSAINQGPQQSSQPSSDAAYQMMLQMAQGQGSQQQPQPQASGGDRDRDWERDDDREQDRGRGRDWDRDRGRGDGDGGREDLYRDHRKKKATLPPHKPANKALIGTKACTFWQQGKCARGDQCTFRHD